MGSNTPTSPSVSPRSSDQNSIEKSKTPFNTKKLFDIAHHNQKTSATFQKRIVNPELRRQSSPRAVSQWNQPTQNEKSIISANWKRKSNVLLYTRAITKQRTTLLRKDVFCYKLLVLPSLWSNDAAAIGIIAAARAFRICERVSRRHC